MKPNQAARIIARSVASSAFVLAAMSAVPAAATTVAFQNVVGEWLLPVPGSTAVTYTGNPGANATVRWGVPSNNANAQSGYNFIGSDVGPLVVPPGGSSGVATIGTFQHVNFPINAGTSITGISLKFTADVLIDNVSVGERNFLYNFSHYETTNGDNPCADGGPQGAGVNVNGCADRVLMNFNSISETFMIGADKYTLDLAGFLVGGNPTTGFWTTENQINTASIQGKVNLYERAVSGGVPEPATWAMMIIGFGASGMMVRNNRRRILARA